MATGVLPLGWTAVNKTPTENKCLVQTGFPVLQFMTAPNGLTVTR